MNNFFGGLFKPLLDWLKSPGFFSWLTGLVGSLISVILGFILGSLTWVGTKLATILIEGKDLAAPALNQVAEVAVKDLFGVSVSIKSGRGGGAEGRNVVAASSIGDAAMKGLFRFTGAAPGGGLQPSSAAATAYLSKVIQMSLEGWVDKFTGECLTIGQVESLGGLDERLERAMGLGTITSRIMGPLAEATVATPFEWQVNRTFRPRLLSASQAVRAHLRGHWTREQMDEELARQGYSADRIESLLQTEPKRLSESELDMLVSSGRWTREQAIQHLLDQGYTADIASTVLDLAEMRRFDQYRRRYAEAGASAYSAGKIDRALFNTILGLSQIPQRERDLLGALAELKRSLDTRSLSMADMESAVRRNILTIAEYREYLRSEGYSDEDARTLELLLLFDIKSATDAAEARRKVEADRAAAAAVKAEADRVRREQIEAELAVREVSLSQMERLVKRGLRSLADYSALLTAEKYSAADVEALTALLAAGLDEVEQKEAERERLRREAAVRKIGLADFEQSVKRGIVSLADYRAFLEGLGYEGDSVDLLVSLLGAELDEAAAAAAARAEAEAELARRDVSLGDAERGARLGFLTIAQYREWLLNAGFELSRVDLLVQLVEFDIASDDAAREKRAAAEARAAERRVSLSDLEAAVRAGLATMSDYRAELARLGFIGSDVDLMAELLELEVSAEAAAIAAREAAAAAAAQRGISLVDMERAVTLGLASIEDYRALLVREGFGTADVSLLSAVLLADLAAVRESEREHAAREAELRERGLSLAQFESAVRAGVRTIGEYQTFLLGQGFDARSVGTLVDLLTLKVEQDRVARAVRAAREAELARRNLSLATWEAAVKAGLRGMEEYRAFLVSQGFSAADVATLIGLLVSEIEAAAAAAE